MNDRKASRNPFNGDDAPSTPHGLPYDEIRLRRFRVEEVYTTAEHVHVLRVRMVSGNVKGTTDMYVERAIGHAAGHVVYAFKPEGGTGKKDVKGKPIMWREMLTLPPNPLRYDLLGCIDDAGTLVWMRARMTMIRGNVTPAPPPPNG